jgi:hypothetical protein
MAVIVAVTVIAVKESLAAFSGGGLAEFLPLGGAII